jgi:hypothetical protein
MRVAIISQFAARRSIANLGSSLNVYVTHACGCKETPIDTCATYDLAVFELSVIALCQRSPNACQTNSGTGNDKKMVIQAA